MAKTYEALMKAEKEQQVRQEDNKVFDIKHKPKINRPVSIQIPFRIEEEYHRMKHKLAVALPETKKKVLLFSCSSHGEGTTSIVLGFATSLAKGNEQVLLVDANVRNPTLHDFLGVDKKTGFVELILGEKSLPEVVKKTKINNLKVITAGILHSNPFSLFESAYLDSLIDQMKNEADWILFDSAPINSYIDSVALASKMDGVLMVVQAEKTRWEVAQTAKKRIEDAQGTLLGVILNRRKMYIPEWAYKLL
ncbi:MAG TPA: CpsD/CapB family tyrosine-protein kinase [Deltaproteobacteria bacterium]|nr:CpsD/CapB family tyrosine-protein kinase [Deltaproteobacteria bacterium]HPJ94460.1 CpsD/CapB family tyrosine-protein kinase [Deltaproteobacteria bacterium]HPR52033.1 CpsD/CapB family tyrosine-protein kinase [Deltaproteobacteria bacterium]